MSESNYEVRRTDDTPSSSGFYALIFLGILCIAALLVLAGHQLGVRHGAEAERAIIIDECNVNQRFHDRKLRYFCTPWPIDSQGGEVES